MSRPAIALMAAAALFIPSAAGAQMLGRDVPHAGTFEVSAGVQSTGSYDFGSSLADETRNPTTGPDPLTLFQGDSSFGRGNGFFARVGIFLRPRIEVEGGVQATRPSLIVRTSGDFESAPDTTIESPLTEYVVDGSLLYHFGRGAFVPFAFGGGGYLRQVLEDASIVETGSEFHGGAGVKYWFGHARRLGIRAEGRASSRSGGVSLDGSSKRRFVPTFSAGAAYLF